MEAQLKGLLSAAYLDAVGFESVGKTNIPAIMRRINPTNGTSMRDSVIHGSQLMLKLYKALLENGHHQKWNFVHVVLTDGADNNSDSSLQDAATMMALIGKMIPVKALKVIFIGVGVEGQAQKELKLLAAIGGQNAQYYNVQSDQIGSIFNKIQVNLGLQKNVSLTGIQTNQGSALMVRQQLNPCLQVSVKNFAVMFNLDVSGSMSGNRWSSVCQSVNQFIGKMGSGDLVSGLVFNNKVRLISKLDDDDALMGKQRQRTQSQTTTVRIVQSNGKEDDCEIM